MNLTIYPDYFTYSNSHQNALACDFDIMPVKDDLLEKKTLELLGITQHGGDPCTNCFGHLLTVNFPTINVFYHNYEVFESMLPLETSLMTRANFCYQNY